MHGCAHGVAPATGYVVDRQPLEEIPEWYEVVWGRMAMCAGDNTRDSLSFDNIEFSSAKLMINAEGAVLAGLWIHPHEIILDDEMLADPYTVAHELGHELFGMNYPHETPEFMRCEWLAIQLRTESLLGILTHYEN